MGFTWPGADLWRERFFKSTYSNKSSRGASYCFTYTQTQAVGQGGGWCCFCWGVCCILISICIQGQKKAANGIIKISNYCQIEARFCPTRNESEMFHLVRTHTHARRTPYVWVCVCQETQWTNSMTAATAPEFETGNWNFSRKWRRKAARVAWEPSTRRAWIVTRNAFCWVRVPTGRAAAWCSLGELELGKYVWLM